MFVRKLFSMLIACYSFSVYAVEATDVYAWTVQDVDHPLWVSLQGVPDHAGPNKTRIKQISGLTCIKDAVGPISTTCEIQKHLIPKQAFGIYTSLHLVENQTNARQLRVKVLGPLIVRGDYNEITDEKHWRYNLSKVYFNHPCQYVHDDIQANRCLGFWAKRIFISYEDWNTQELGDVLKAKDGILPVTELIFGKEEMHKTQEAINQADAFSVMLEFQESVHIYYLGLKYGVGTIPVVIQAVDSADIPRAIARRLVERAEKEKVPVTDLVEQFNSQLDDFTDKIVFRNANAQFQAFRADLKKNIEDELQKLH